MNLAAHAHNKVNANGHRRRTVQMSKTQCVDCSSAHDAREMMNCKLCGSMVCPNCSQRQGHLCSNCLGEEGQYGMD